MHKLYGFKTHKIIVQSALYLGLFASQGTYPPRPFYRSLDNEKMACKDVGFTSVLFSVAFSSGKNLFFMQST